MISATWDFLKRHKNKIIGGAIAVGVIGGVYYWYKQTQNEEKFEEEISYKYFL